MYEILVKHIISKNNLRSFWWIICSPPWLLKKWNLPERNAPKFLRQGGGSFLKFRFWNSIAEINIYKIVLTFFFKLDLISCILTESQKPHDIISPSDVMDLIFLRLICFVVTIYYIIHTYVILYTSIRISKHFSDFLNVSVILGQDISDWTI